MGEESGLWKWGRSRHPSTWERVKEEKPVRNVLWHCPFKKRKIWFPVFFLLGWHNAYEVSESRGGPLRSESWGAGLNMGHFLFDFEFVHAVMDWVCVTTASSWLVCLCRIVFRCVSGSQQGQGRVGGGRVARGCAGDLLTLATVVWINAAVPLDNWNPDISSIVEGIFVCLGFCCLFWGL